MGKQEYFEVQGSDDRKSILQSIDLSNVGPGLVGSSYSYADNLPNPNKNGGTNGGSMGDVISQLKNVAYYIDAIGAGSSTNALTKNMGMQPLGVNYFIPTGQTCSNGAQMWEYMQGIPQGTAFGKDLKQALADMQMPQLQGLAPGILEDVEAAVDVMPLLNALTGTGYSDCKQVTLQVGDLKGNIGPNGDWIANAETAFRGDNSGKDSYGQRLNPNLYYQTRWVQNTNDKGRPITLSKEEYDAINKTYKFDGTLEKFSQQTIKPHTIIAIGILCVLAFGFIKH
jgi:hypothetical protein